MFRPEALAEKAAAPLVEVGLAAAELLPDAEGWRTEYSDGVVYTIESRSAHDIARKPGGLLWIL